MNFAMGLECSKISSEYNASVCLIAHISLLRAARWAWAACPEVASVTLEHRLSLGNPVRKDTPNAFREPRPQFIERRWDLQHNTTHNARS